ncbi:kinase-like protein, partial [Ceraceosorus guamensis]
MHCLTDEELGERYGFEKEIGSGNWGSCWKAVITHSLREYASGKPQRRTVAVKLVVRDHSSASKSRVKALWNEFKVMRSACSFEEMHPNLVVFREFLFSPSYACLTMDFFDQAMQVCLSRWVYAGPDGFFQQLTSAVAWLHARNITHCDIKVQNMMVHPGPDGRERPILLDFGFAKNHDPNSGFITNARWGTPEYLSPERARGDDHDERLADVWALGVSLYEIAVGRTPFENVNETFLDTESLTLYYERTVMSAWQGNWDMISVHCESLVRAMVEPDTKKRIQAKDA